MRLPGFINKIVEDYAQKRLFGVGPTDDWSYVDKFSGPAKDFKLLGFYQGLAFRCIDTIATSMAKYKPYFYTTDSSGKKTTIAQHPLLDVIEHPNPNLTKFQLLEGSAVFMELYGECFWYMVPGKVTGFDLNGPKQIILLSPDKMGINVDQDTGEVIGYTYNAGSGRRVPFEVEEILHHRTFNPRNPYRGYSLVEAAVDYIGTEEEVSRFTRRYFHNNAALSGVLSVSGKIAKESWKKFVRQWRERYEGVDNAGKVAIVRDSQLDFKQIGSSVKDMDMTNLKQITMDQVLMMFKIPKGLLGLESGEGLGRASVETLEYIFTKWTIDTKECRMDDTLQTALDRYFPNNGLLTDHITQIPVDKEYQLQVFDRGVDRWLTRKEIREQDPQTASTDIEGSDQLFVAMTMEPLKDGATLAEDKPAPPIPPAKDPDDDDDNDSGSGNDDDDDSEKMVVLKAKKKVKSLQYSVSQKEVFRQTLEDNAKAYVKKYAKAFVKVLDAQEQEVLSNITHMAGKSLSDDLFNLSESYADFNSALVPILTQLALEQGQLSLEFAGATDAKYELSRSMLTAIQDSTKRMAGNFNSETLLRLNDTLTEGLSAGEGADQLSGRVADVYSQAKDWRTDRVSRTESMNAANSSTLDAYKQTSYVTAMTWFANPGACEYCDSLNGTTVALDQSFVTQGDSVDVTQDDGSTHSYQADYGDVETPPLHPNCSCTIIPVTQAE